MIGEPDGADFSFLFQLQERAPVVFERRAVLGGPMHLVQVDALDGEPAERRFDLAANAQGIAYATRRGRAVALVPHEARLGGPGGPVVGPGVAPPAGRQPLGGTEAAPPPRT